MALQELVYPVEALWFQVEKGTGNIWNRYLQLSDAAAQNDELRQRLGALQTRIVDYEEQIAENDRLRNLLGFARRAPKRLVAAEVIGIADGTAFLTMRITRGAGDGIQAGMPVVAAAGVVGRIIRVGQRFADVQLLADPDFHLDVLLQRTRVRGVLAGRNRMDAKLDLHKRADIRIGDTVITSGIVGGFPKGLPVGRVVRISYESEDVAQAITIEPWVDYRQLEEVMVIFNNDRELAKIIETAGHGWVEKALMLPRN